MRTSANQNDKLQVVRADLTEVISRLRAYRGYPEAEIEIAISHLQRALEEVDQALVSSGPQVLAQPGH